MKGIKMEAKKGDVVVMKGNRYEIAEIFDQDYWERGAADDGWMIEFRDTKGNYHCWKQYLDGGTLERK